MPGDGASSDFRLLVTDVFELTDRGTVAIGPILTGHLRSGQKIMILRDDEPCATATAHVELIRKPGADPRSVAILLRDLGPGRPRSGDVIVSQSVQPKSPVEPAPGDVRPPAVE